MATRLATVLKGLIGILFLKNKIRILNDLKNGAAKLSYSQQCEDLTLQRHLPKKEKGFYVDIGAFHPKLESPV